MKEKLGSTVAARLGCSTITFRDLPLADALARIKESGLAKVDIACIPGFCPHIDPLEITDQEVDGLRSQLKSMGFTVSTLNVSAGGLNGEKSDFVCRFYDAAIGLAARLGCYAITIPSGSKVDQSVWKVNAETSIGLIKKLADHASESGVELTLEAPHPGTLAETVPEAKAFFDALSDTRVGCTFDTSHVARGNAVPVADCIDMVGARVGHLHLRDCIGENNHLTPGKGDVDFAAVLTALDRRGYTGDIIFELEGKDSSQAYPELVSAKEFILALE